MYVLCWVGEGLCVEASLRGQMFLRASDLLPVTGRLGQVTTSQLDLGLVTHVYIPDTVFYSLRTTREKMGNMYRPFKVRKTTVQAGAPS